MTGLVENCRAASVSRSDRSQATTAPQAKGINHFMRSLVQIQRQGKMKDLRGAASGCRIVS